MPRMNYKTLSVSCDDSGIFRIVIDVHGRPLNVIDADVMQDLADVVTDLESRDDVKLVVFKSGKESGFFAGADVSIIQSIENAKQADQLLFAGQRLFARIEDLSMPTLAIIHGPCLGGGLELALACDYRIARDNSSTKIGLPEIKLGLIPGWGGTQRLTRQVGLKQSLSLVLNGKHLSAREASKIGLIDRAIDPDSWRDSLILIIDRLSRGKLIRSGGSWRRDLFNRVQAAGWVRDKILSVARRSIAKRSRHFPALDSAIHAIEDSYRQGGRGFHTEREEFQRLLFTPTCRNLLRLFFARERARSLNTWTSEVTRVIHQEPIRRLGVIGGGVMGAGIAFCAATRGFPTTIKEIDENSASSARQRISKLAADYARHKRLDRDDAEQLHSLVTVNTDAMDIADANCVVEAIVERMDIKKTVLRDIESLVCNSTAIATNTSALSVTEMGTGLKHPERFAGLHFFNPVGRMELVEIVRGESTSDPTIAKLVAFVKALGKTPIVTKDSPGFLVNRILFPYLGEAMLMVQQRFDVRSIDKELRDFGMPMGPLQLLDQVGLDVALHVASTLKSMMPAAAAVIEILDGLVSRGELGRKAGQGFYDYSAKRPVARKARKLVDFFVQPPPRVDFLEDGLTQIQRRLVYPMLLESKRCLAERVVEDAESVDLGMILGTGFAPQLGGPMQVIDKIGHECFETNLARLALQLGDRFADVASPCEPSSKNETLTR